MKDEIPKARIRDWLNVYRGRSLGVCIDGDSMSPTLISGERVFVDKRADVRPGDIILIAHPFRRSVKIVKRLVELSPEGKMYVTGDDPNQSHDSRGFGYIARENLLGKVVAKARK